MKNILNFIFAIIYGTFPFLLAGILGFLIYNELPNLYGIAICFVLVLIASYLSVKVFKGIRRKGFINFTAKIYENSEMNNDNNEQKIAK